MIDKKQIEAYHLAEFCQLAQEKFLEGFTFDFEDNAHYPTSFGTFFTATMVKKEKEVLAPELLTPELPVEEVKAEVPATEVESPVEVPATKGRPKKV